MERDIDYVIAVAECGSISQAAEMLYISQPSLSRYISSLEHDLGVGLFVRTINGTELTEAGKIYLKYAKEIKLLREPWSMNCENSSKRI
ncbi:MAG: LysR family transcriptional regulator [Enterocloster sp.]